MEKYEGSYIFSSVEVGEDLMQEREADDESANDLKREVGSLHK